MRLPFKPNALSRSLCIVGAVLAAAMLSGCATKQNPLIDEPIASGTQTTAPTGVQRVFWIFSPYRIDVQQGNFISQEMVAQLKEGMTQDQVRFVLGTPLLTDMFHADRWDYPFRLQKGNGELTTSHVVVFFKEGRMVRFEGGDLPTEKDYINRIAGTTQK